MSTDIRTAPQSTEGYLRRVAAEDRIKFYGVSEGMRAALLQSLSQSNPADEVKRIVRDASQHPTYPRKCLSCGASESLDGSVPCGH
ncbi:hypothetical protein [Burkholderia sp. Bp9099]|uniref:hypothetical protein n=1 Tax=Burkholderia sp. Bp9099 TaxID=2184568 RepID=UPI000F5EC0D6|nr:hypothetical protein [Burkholderia sp. Bp9099]